MTTESFLWLLFYLVPVLYAAAFAAYLVVFFSDRRTPRKLARPVLVSAVAEEDHQVRGKGGRVQHGHQVEE